MSRRVSRVFVFTAIAIFLVACEQSSESANASDCEVREYQEQALVLDKSPIRRKDGPLSASATNFTAFRDNYDPWLIEGFVILHDRRTLRLEARAVESFAELDANTSFLVVVASQDFKMENLLSKYFDGSYRHININAVCPIYVGKRNGTFALATRRDRHLRSGNENYRECALGSSLAFFGLPDSELSNFENYIKPDLLPRMWFYDTEKIRLLLAENTKC